MATTLVHPVADIVYPESDGNPISDHTLQFEWITMIKGNLDILFADNSDVFVAGDLLWYPVEGEPKIRMAPDAMVVFGRPKADRGSYRQWMEGNVPPQVVFEIMSPGNRPSEMFGKLLFYVKHGVQEYYFYDPFSYDFSVCVRSEDGLGLDEVTFEGVWTSPSLGVRFESIQGEKLKVFQPTGEPFLSFVELEQRRRQLARERDAAVQRAEVLAERLRALGVDPDTL